MNELPPLEQGFLLKQLIPEIISNGAKYKKFQPVLARAADAGEKIITHTSSGKETENIASGSDYVVKNRTIAAEQYIVPKATFESRYSFSKEIDDNWSEYLPSGEVMAIAVDSRLLSLLDRSGAFLIDVNWGSTQVVREGDFFATPYPDMNEIYRIDQLEFGQTYKLAD